MNTDHPEIPEFLVDSVRRREVILFAGGGISQNLGLPDFNELISYLAEQLGMTGGDFSLNDYPVVAEAYIQTSGKMGALRSWMDTTWHPSTIDVSKSAVHNLIVDLNFSTIYTTNYDRWLEKAFDAQGKKYRKITNVADLTHPRDDSTEIIKFHGDFEDDDSLVLTEASYFRRMSFETPLDIRLRADSLARPLLFVGYSLQDMNTRYPLFRLQELWEQSKCAGRRPMSYVLMTQSQPAQETVLRSRGVEPLVWQDEDPGRATRLFLEKLREAARAKV
ncbi:MAG TPA: SIR2 family protein [Acidobacteriaceae bacterium]|jgi:hypothetical protein|nr:SIR2 family protein [Acidobacteriaceae bacterium]